MGKIQSYFIESFNELKNNVTWPTWENLQQTAMVVLGATLFIALMIMLMDGVFNKLMSAIYGV
jgi:preprotein translocase subunit SecE